MNRRHLAALSANPRMLEEVWGWGQMYPPADVAAPLWPAWDEEDADGLTPLHVAALADRGRGIVAGLLQRCAETRAAWDTPAPGKRFSPAQVFLPHLFPDDHFSTDQHWSTLVHTIDCDKRIPLCKSVAFNLTCKLCKQY